MRQRTAVAVISTPGEDIAGHMRDLLELVGEDPARDGLRRTPERWEKAMRFLTGGYRTRVGDIANGALFAVKFSEMVLVKNIEFFSLCEHRLLPFYDKIHVACLSGEKVIGLSRIPRIVNMFARRLQVQERLTQEVADAISESIAPRGVAVMCEASHFCMMMRGVEKQCSSTVTSAMVGAFREDAATRNEFLSQVGRCRSSPAV